MDETGLVLSILFVYCTEPAYICLLHCNFFLVLSPPPLAALSRIFPSMTYLLYTGMQSAVYSTFFKISHTDTFNNKKTAQSLILLLLAVQFLD